MCLSTHRVGITCVGAHVVSHPNSQIEKSKVGKPYSSIIPFNGQVYLFRLVFSANSLNKYSFLGKA